MTEHEKEIIARIGTEVRQKQEHEIALMQKHIDNASFSLCEKTDEMLDALFNRYPDVALWALKKPVGIYQSWTGTTFRIIRLERKVLSRQYGHYEVFAHDKEDASLYVNELPVSDKIEIIYHLRLAQGDDV